MPRSIIDFWSWCVKRSSRNHATSEMSSHKVTSGHEVVTTLSSLAQNYPVFPQILLVYPLCPQVYRLKVQKTQYSVLCKVFRGTDTMPIKIPEEYFIETVQLILKCVWWCKKKTRSWNDFEGKKRWTWKAGTTWVRTSTTPYHVHKA